MVTSHQLVQGCRKRYLKKRSILSTKPQQKGVCSRLFIRTPKKPNSAKRKVVSVTFLRRIYGKRSIHVKKGHVQCYIPGIGHNLQQNSVVLFRGGRVPDLPGVNYHLIRGVLDFKGVAGRKSSRSKYGAQRGIAPAVA